MTAVFAHVYDVHDGRIVRFRQFTDTWPMLAAIHEGVRCRSELRAQSGATKTEIAT